jgi:hypothetical protein
MRIFFVIVTILLLVVNTFAQQYSIISSDEEKIILEVDFNKLYSIKDTLIQNKIFHLITGGDNDVTRMPGEPWLPNIVYNIGIPHNSNPTLKEISFEKESFERINILPFPKEDPYHAKSLETNEFDYNIYSKSELFPKDFIQVNNTFIVRYARVLALNISPYQYNPVSRELTFYKKIKFTINFNSNSLVNGKKIFWDSFSQDFLRNNTLNAEVAQRWLETTGNQIQSNNYWYSPNKTWYKLYLNRNGVYRVTYQDLINFGVNPGLIGQFDKVALYTGGALVPIDVFDLNDDDIFNSGDYIQFIGYPAPKSPFAEQNIYNTSNIYWITFENETKQGRYANYQSDHSFFVRNYQSNYKTDHFERDSLYEKLGHASNDNQDYWYWDRAEAKNAQQGYFFTGRFQTPSDFNFDLGYLNVKAELMGITKNDNCNPDHKAYVQITGKEIGNITWDGQSKALFDKTVNVIQDSIGLYPEGNNLQILVKGDICNGTDEIRINWFKLTYNRYNRIDTNFYYFTTKNLTQGINRYQLWNWNENQLLIYSPKNGRKIVNPERLNDIWNSIVFVDTLADEELDYYCVSVNHFMSIDSMRIDKASDLRNASNGADYIIITHPKFTSVANTLADFRSTNFPDTTIHNPRIKVVQIDDIYDEFSHGLMDPFAMRKFAEYAFDNYVQPAPLYVVLLGDMSYDYRKILPNSRDNYIPSIPYHSFQYGQAASDNNIVSFKGNDLIPEMIIGRLSCETVEEGNILIDKIMNYPSDNSKQWKQNVLLISSGLNANDENYFRFNESNMYLDETYLKPLGITSRKVFRYINKPELQPFQGEGPQIKNGFNEGAVLANYYGHGGGYQWDLVFNNDDIYQLTNGGRLPVIMSVTCYTAHFDNQDVFGEQFNKVPGKGSIGFFGSSGLTLWGIGKAINQLVYENIFRNREYIIGRAIFKSKIISPGGYFDSQIALLTYLGDPVMKLAFPSNPDFTLKSSDIKIDKDNIISGDSVNVNVTIRNLGIIFPNDTVSVKLRVVSSDTSYTVGTNMIGSFGETDSTSFLWNPNKGGLYELIVLINEDQTVIEEDYSDNSARSSFAVYDLKTPNIVKPFDGITLKDTIEFLFIDNGFYVDEELVYYIQVDTSLNFSMPIINSGAVKPNEGLLKWTSPPLAAGEYFWRTRIFTSSDSSEWSKVRILSIGDNVIPGYMVKGKNLKLLKNYNMNYIPDHNSIILNTDLQPPKPSTNRFIEDINPVLPEDLKALNSITTDGKYIYAGHLTYFDGLTKIYKIGTGYGGTEAGQMYGAVSDHKVKIWHTMTYHKGWLYFAQEDPHNILRMNIETGDTITYHIPVGLLNQTGQVKEGAFSISSDGERFYSLAFRDSLGNEKYKLRILNAADDNQWYLEKEVEFPDRALPYHTAFFVSDNYLFVYENFWGGYMRRINIETKNYEEEWLTHIPVEFYYTWASDPLNNVVYGAVFHNDRLPKISKFQGKYVDANGLIETEPIGPAKKWNQISYEVERTQGQYNSVLTAYNNITASWDTISYNFNNGMDLSNIDPVTYPHLKLSFNFVDSSFSSFNPIKFKSLHLNYESLPEILISDKEFSFTADSVLQGFDTEMILTVRNIGYSSAENLGIEFFMNDADSSFYKTTISLEKDSISNVSKIINTASYPPATPYSVKGFAKLSTPEFYTVNNLAKSRFYVRRDSLKPNMKITFDGEEILNNDIISSTPEVVITMKDDSPLPLDKSYFTLVHTEHAKNKRNILSFDSSNISYNYTPYPNSEAKIIWNPTLGSGKHTLEVLGKDASGNFHDSTSHKSVFQVYSEPDLKHVFNYPNPFKNDTHFTFEIRGAEPPDEFYIKIYTVAGRLIRDMNIPAEEIRIGFNKFYWDGRDEDGDEIANGVYFYKVIYKHKDLVKTEIEKLAKVK